MNRFWVGGPCYDGSEEQWLVIDAKDLPGLRPARKPAGYQEVWATEALAQEHTNVLNAMVA